MQFTSDFHVRVQIVFPAYCKRLHFLRLILHAHIKKNIPLLKILINTKKPNKVMYHFIWLFTLQRRGQSFNMFKYYPIIAHYPVYLLVLSLVSRQDSTAHLFPEMFLKKLILEQLKLLDCFVMQH